MTSLATLIWPIASSAAPPAQDPWTKAPPLPTTCYLESDNYPDKFRAAIDAVQADMERQEQINDQLRELVAQLDPMEQASRMQKYMMANPEEGMKLMQQNATLAETITATRLQFDGNRQNLENELSDLLTRYNTALDSVLAPIQAKFKDLDVRAQKDLVAVGETWSYAPWAVKEYNVLNAQSNKSYETVCASWWAANGAFHGWMKKYKDNLIKEIPTYEEADKLGAGFMIVLVGTPESPYKPTATFRATRDYILKTIDLFDKRQSRPGRDY